MSSELDIPVTQETDPAYVETGYVSGVATDNRETQTPKLVGTASGRMMRLCYYVGDVLAVAVGLLFAQLATSWLSGSLWQSVTALEWKFFGIFALGMLIVSAWSGSYKAVPPRPARQFRTWTIGTTIVIVAILVSSWTFDLEFAQIAPALILATTATHLTACFLRAFCRISFGKKDWWGTRVVVIGSGPSAREAMRYMVREPQWGMRPVGFMAEDDSTRDVEMPLPFLGTLDDLSQVAKQTGVQRALVALHPFDLKQMREHFYRPDATIRHWIVIPSTDYFNVLWSEWNETARMPAVTVSNSLAMKRARILKRAFDLVLAGAISLLLLPLILLISVVIKLTSEGPIFYTHRRIGKNGEPFEAWKFRTMVQNADDALKKYFEENPELRDEWTNHQKLKHDPRITSIGNFLRATSLDELPQLWNVLKGDMSLVGPRPIVASEANKYQTLFGHYQQVLPGITGLWQVSGRNDTTYKERIDLDVYYVENWSIWLDIYILACTIKVVLLREGAY